MKKVIFSIVLMALATSLAFSQAPVVAAAKGKNVEIKLWTHDDANRGPLEKQFIEEFMAANPTVKVIYSSYPSGKILETLTTAFAANQGPDIFNVSIGSAIPFIDYGRVAPVNYKAVGVKNVAELEASYQPGSLEAVKLDGEIYGMPLELTNMCLYINKKMFAEAGLNAEKDYPKTWEDVMAISEKIVRRNGQIITRRGFDFRYDAYPNTFLPMVEQLGGQLVSKDGKTAIIGDEAWIKVLQYVKDFGPAGKNLGSPTYTAARTEFDKNTGLIAMSFSGLYQEARMKTSNPAFYDSKDWMVVPFPQWKNSSKFVPANYSGHYYMVNAQSTKLQQEVAWTLLNYMLDHGEQYLQKVAIVQPTQKLTQSAYYKSMPFSDVFSKDFAAAKIVYVGKGSSQINVSLKEAFNSVMLAGVEPKAAFEKLRKDAQEALNAED